MSTGRRSDATLTATLVFVTMVAAVISSLGAPLIPGIARSLHTSLSTAQWSLTVALLSGAVGAPIMGRLGDGPHRRGALLTALAAVTAGGVVAALASSLLWLLVGRALQGVGLGLVPLTMAAARDHLPAARVPSVIALLSVCAAAAVGAGYPVSGLIADSFGLSAAFWFGAVAGGLALLAVAVVVPPSSSREAAALDVRGVTLLTGGLISLLLAIAEGNRWGWASATTLGLFAAAAVLLAWWVAEQLRSAAPLVELRLLRVPAVLSADACAFVLGVAMYMDLSSITEFVQTPRSAGYGFSSSIVVAGSCLVPFSVFSLAASRALPMLYELVGLRAVLPLGSLIVAGSGAFFAGFHDAFWESLVMMSILGVGVGMTFAAIPGILVRAVPKHETGSAMGFYQVVRFIGFSLGSALTASILASRTPAGSHLPSASAFPLTLWTGVGICLAAAALAWALPADRDVASVAGRSRLGEEDAELAVSGLTGPTHE